MNVAAFLLMDSQKDSTSPGHPKPAQPLSGIHLLCTHFWQACEILLVIPLDLAALSLLLSCLMPLSEVM